MALIPSILASEPVLREPAAQGAEYNGPARQATGQWTFDGDVSSQFQDPDLSRKSTNTKAYRIEKSMWVICHFITICMACEGLTLLVLRTGLVSSASGSAYLEIEQSIICDKRAEVLLNVGSTLKILCAVHGPRPLPKSATFSPLLKLSTSIIFADSALAVKQSGSKPALQERELSVRLEAALRGLIISERWPKSGVEVVITIIETESRCLNSSNEQEWTEYILLPVLSGCITVASAAIVDAGIDCFDIITGGVVALVKQRKAELPTPTSCHSNISDPSFLDDESIAAVCLVAYSHSRDELTELWVKGDASRTAEFCGTGSWSIDDMIDQAVEAAKSVRLVFMQSLK